MWLILVFGKGSLGPLISALRRVACYDGTNSDIRFQKKSQKAVLGSLRLIDV